MAKILIIATILCIQVISSLSNYICTQPGTYNTYYPQNCKKYYTCENGQPTEHECGLFHQFDENTHECRVKVWIFGSTNCSQALKPTKPTTSTTTVKPTGTPPGTAKTTTGKVTTSKGGSTKSSTTTPKSNKSTTTKKNAAATNELSMVIALICLLGLVSLRYNN